MAYQSILNPMPITGALTDTQLRAAAVPVSMASTTITGSVTVTGGLTDTQLRASAVSVSLASTTITGSVAITAAALPLPAGAATDATLIGGTQRTKITDGTNNVGIASGVTAASELLADRMKVNAEFRLLDTSQPAGSQLVAGRGDQTNGLWVNNRNPDQIEMLFAILNELRTISAVLQVGLSVSDDLSLLRNDAALIIN